MKIILTESQLKTVINEKLSDTQKKNALKRAKKLTPKFSSVNQFSLKYPNLYNYLRFHNLLDDAFPERKKYHPEGYWTPETIDQEAKKYSSRTEFDDKNQVAYKKANELGMLDMLFPTRKTKYTLDKALDLAKEFESPWDLNKKYPTAYNLLKLTNNSINPILVGFTQNNNNNNWQLSVSNNFSYK
jgi:hypothetical protein